MPTLAKPVLMENSNQIHETFTHSFIPFPFQWTNPPKQFQTGNGLEITTGANTDFWQRTHYDFNRDSGHALLAKVKGDFTLTTHGSFHPNAQYDQCGLLIRENSENWVKAAIEYEDPVISRLGSVVTNMGFSDWATQDVLSTIKEKWFRLSKLMNDILIEHSDDGYRWKQMRIAHLHHSNRELKIGVYACSPKGKGFSCRFHSIQVTECKWEL